jgi:hypothetical protein
VFPDYVLTARATLGRALAHCIDLASGILKRNYIKCSNWITIVLSSVAFRQAGLVTKILASICSTRSQDN